jgi:hypothetical protein
MDMQTIIDNFQRSLNTMFAEFTLATSCAEVGFQLISKSGSEKTVSLKLGEELFTEPVSFSELLSNSQDVKSKGNSFYQNMMIAAWSDLIDEIFEYFLAQHFDGHRDFVELKRQNIKIDFASSISIEVQAKDALSKDFSFRSYPDRFKLINGILNPGNELDAEIKIIRKHVLIRNSIQHHNSIAYEDLFSQLGAANIELLDPNGAPLSVTQGNKIYISVPELDYLKRAQHLVSQKWRSFNA